MISVDSIAGRKFSSNVYLISHTVYQNSHYLIDAGCIEGLVTILDNIQSINAVFLTHTHYDHIQDLNLVMEKFPNLNIYCSDKAVIGLKNPKINLSYYHGDPIVCKTHNCEVVFDNDEIPIFCGDAFVKVIETPGHTNDSLSFILDNFVFTGDALIPNIPVVTKLRTGNKSMARDSAIKLKDIIEERDIICPGHLQQRFVSEVEWDVYL